METSLTKEEDRAFYAVLMRDIPYFHHLYSKYKDPTYLEIAQNLGTYAKSIKRKYDVA